MPKLFTVIFVFLGMIPCSASQTLADSCLSKFSPHFSAGESSLFPSAVAKWSMPGKTTVTPIQKQFLNRLEHNGAVVITAGGSSISCLVPGKATSTKIYFKKSPGTVAELVGMFADAAEPSLKSLASTEKLANRRAPIIILPAPGLVLENRTLVFPGNFGKLAGQKADLAALLPVELAKRAKRIGLSQEQLLKTRVHVDNDALPIVADAAIQKLKNQDHATVVFVGTGTGSAKVTMTGPQAFRMQALEESHLHIDQFPTVSQKVPAHILLGAKIAAAKSSDYRVVRLELEQLSGGGRIMDPVTGVRSHLGGANSVALNYLFLKPKDIPQWMRVKGETPAALKKQFMASLGFKETKEVQDLLAQNPADRKLFETLRAHGSLGTQEISQAADQGSLIAQKIISDNTYSQGLVAGTISLNVGDTPAGAAIEASWIFGEPKAADFQIKILARASDGLNAWSGSGFERAKQGIEDAKNAVFLDKAYLEKLRQQGYVLDPARVKMSLVRIVPAPDLHPDFSGLDVFSNQLRADLNESL